MNTFLWAAQGLMALVFFGSGVAKAIMSKEQMAATGQTGVAPYPLPFIRFIAICEILGATGLILPLALGKCSFLTPLAACGLGIIMVGAGVTHWKLRELKNVVTNVVLFIFCLFVAWGRF